METAATLLPPPVPVRLSVDVLFIAGSADTPEFEFGVFGDDSSASCSPSTLSVTPRQLSQNSSAPPLGRTSCLGLLQLCVIVAPTATTVIHPFSRLYSDKVSYVQLQHSSFDMLASK